MSRTYRCDGCREVRAAGKLEPITLQLPQEEPDHFALIGTYCQKCVRAVLAGVGQLTPQDGVLGRTAREAAETVGSPAVRELEAHGLVVVPRVTWQYLVDTNRVLATENQAAHERLAEARRKERG